MPRYPRGKAGVVARDRGVFILLDSEQESAEAQAIACLSITPDTKEHNNLGRNLQLTSVYSDSTLVNVNLYNSAC